MLAACFKHSQLRFHFTACCDNMLRARAPLAPLLLVLAGPDSARCLQQYRPWLGHRSLPTAATFLGAKGPRSHTPAVACVGAAQSSLNNTAQSARRKDLSAAWSLSALISALCLWLLVHQSSGVVMLFQGIDMLLPGHAYALMCHVWPLPAPLVMCSQHQGMFSPFRRIAPAACSGLFTVCRCGAWVSL